MASRLSRDALHGTDLPASGGSYLLVLPVRRPLVLSVGKLGRLRIRDGTYVYAGSAQGPGGLRARVGRHLSGGRRRWHVDYLRAVAAPMGALTLAAAGRWECTWAGELASRSGCEPVAGFGASDCGCPAHLFRLPDRLPSLAEIVSTPAGCELVWHPVESA